MTTRERALHNAEAVHKSFPHLLAGHIRQLDACKSDEARRLI